MDLTAGDAPWPGAPCPIRLGRLRPLPEQPGTRRGAARRARGIVSREISSPGAIFPLTPATDLSIMRVRAAGQCPSFHADGYSQSQS